MILSATASYGMQAGVESTSATLDGVRAWTAPTSLEAATTAPARSVVVVISFVDASGNREQLGRMTTAERVSANCLLVNLEDVHAVVAEICDSSWTSPLLPAPNRQLGIAASTVPEF
jgi:hypothetical protein